MGTNGTDGALLDERPRLDYTRRTILPLRDMAADACDEFVAYTLEVLVGHVTERLQELKAEAASAAESV